MEREEGRGDCETVVTYQKSRKNRFSVLLKTKKSAFQICEETIC